MRRIGNLYDNMICYRNIVFVYNRIRSKSHNKNKIMCFIRYNSNTIRRINRKIKYLYDNDFDLFFRSISSYKGYFIRCNTSLFFSRYNDLCMNSRYDKYLVIKKRYSNYLVFIKYRNRYYTYGNDLCYVNKSFGTNYRWFKRSVVYSFDNVIIFMDNSVVVRG